MLFKSSLELYLLFIYSLHNEAASFSILYVIILAITSALGTSTIVIAIGLLKGKRWSWNLALMYSIVGIILYPVFYGLIRIYNANMIMGGIMSVIFNSSLIYCLFTNHVKRYVGKRTFAIRGKKEAEEILRKESLDKKMSVNLLLSQIITKYFQWERRCFSI